MGFLTHPSSVTLEFHFLFVIAISIRVIMKRPAPSVALAWLLLIAAIPLVGVVMYLLIGERRIGRTRVKRVEKLREDFGAIAEEAIKIGLTDVDWDRHPNAARGLNQIGNTLGGSPTVHGSDLQLFDDTEEILAAIAKDVDEATTSVLIEFYIWNKGGRADDVLEAVIRASERGVKCFLLVDAIGAAPWWRTDQPKRLRNAGVELRQALPVGLIRPLFGRTDLRLHRKIVVVDGEVAWTGSMNLVDPKFFKQNAGVGEWVDAMVRVKGAAVAALASVMIGDWMVETGQPLREMIEVAGLRLVEPVGEADIQVIPSGPEQTSDGILQMIVGLANAAQKELILTTPYLIPDESLLRAIRGAAARGVAVSVIVPEKVDSLLARYASRSYYDDLIDVGVQIYLYQGGLLHTKSIIADEAMAMFGTVNLDMRSLWLNFEVSLFVYDETFAKESTALQRSYLADSQRLDPDVWNQRPALRRFFENTMRMFSPLL